MFPLGDDNPTRTRPVMTWLLIAANAAVFIAYNLQLTPVELERWTLDWGYDPDHPFSRQIFTSMFMHGGWGHILGNMWVLWIMGDNVEDKVGKVRYLILYVAGGCAAALAFAGITHVVHTNPEILEKLGRQPPLVGASGAIAAIMGMYLVFFPEARIRLLVFFFIFVQVVMVRAKWFIGLTLLLDLFRSAIAGQAASGGVATMAHVGGGLFGIVAAALLKPSLGGGAEGDVWDVHTGFARRPNAEAQRWLDDRLPGGARMAPHEVDPAATSDLENHIANLVRAGRVREAIDLYPAYVAAAREQPLPDDVQIEIAHELYRQWLPKEAIPAYRRYLEASPEGADAAEAKFRIGVLHARGTGNREEAERWLRAAVHEHPDPRIRAAATELLARLA